MNQRHPTPAEGTVTPPLAPLEALFEPEYPEFWRDMATGLYLELVRSGQLSTPGDCARLAVGQTLRFVEMFGGHQYYIPAGKALKDRATVRAVVEGFNGRNHVELGRRLGITSNRVRRILKDFGEERMKRRASVHPGNI